MRARGDASFSWGVRGACARCRLRARYAGRGRAGFDGDVRPRRDDRQRWLERREHDDADNDQHHRERRRTVERWLGRRRRLRPAGARVQRQLHRQHAAVGLLPIADVHALSNGDERNGHLHHHRRLRLHLHASLPEERQQLRLPTAVLHQPGLLGSHHLPERSVPVRQLGMHGVLRADVLHRHLHRQHLPVRVSGIAARRLDGALGD